LSQDQIVLLVYYYTTVCSGVCL